MRERPKKIFVHPLAYGITPAYAGKTLRLGVLATTIGDHPRVCGKDCGLLGGVRCKIGSPPRMRERPFFAATSHLSVRITPAYAGKTFLCGHFTPQCEDHPRVCGKDCGVLWSYLVLMGSPPRMRERPEERKADDANIRITPAYAGKT